jgi:acetyl-CoA carboxylase biotin carboxyl carrier protein
VNLSNEDIQDILSLLDSLPYAEFTLETTRFTLQLRRSAEGAWTQETQVLPRPMPADPAPVPTGPALRATPAAAPAPPGEPNSPAKPAAPSGAGEPRPPASSGPGEPNSPAPSEPGEPNSPASNGPGADVRDIVSPLPGTFYRAPQPGARPFTEVGGDVEPTSVVAIIETMKLLNPVYAGTAGTVTQICLDDGQFAEQGTVLMRVSPRAG